MTSKKKQKIEETAICPECESTNINRDAFRAELICDDCGLVIEEGLIDYGPEWRAFDSDQREKRAHTGPPMTYMIHDKGLSTVIGWQNRDSYGKTIPMKNRTQLFRLRKWQKIIRIGDSVDRNIALALSSINRISSAMGLPRNIREAAAMIYRQAALKKLVRGRSIEGIAAATLYVACRQCQLPRTLDEISKITNIPKRDIGRNYRFIARELGLKMMPVSPEDYISRFCSGLKLNGETQAKATHILREAADKGLTCGQNPTGVAAASLYIASVLCGERRTQREIAEMTGITEVTIRNRYKDLSEKLDIEIIL